MVSPQTKELERQTLALQGFSLGALPLKMSKTAVTKWEHFLVTDVAKHVLLSLRICIHILIHYISFRVTGSVHWALTLHQVAAECDGSHKRVAPAFGTEMYHTFHWHLLGSCQFFLFRHAYFCEGNRNETQDTAVESRYHMLQLRSESQSHRSWGKNFDKGKSCCYCQICKFNFCARTSYPKHRPVASPKMTTLDVFSRNTWSFCSSWGVSSVKMHCGFSALGIIVWLSRQHRWQAKSWNLRVAHHSFENNKRHRRAAPGKAHGCVSFPS